MTITLDHIIPVPMRDKVPNRQSDIWNCHQQFEPGSWVKIKAPSGTGKTTFTHIIWQLRNDFTGKLLIDKKDSNQISANEKADLRQTKMSVIFQDLRLFGNLTARENIELKRVMHNPPFCTADTIDDMAEALGVRHILNQKASTCSYGEQQRIAIIRALMQPFEWLIMDEPFSHLDQANTAKAAALIAQECLKRNAGFLLTDLDEDEHFNYTRKLLL
jgi:ABC-type lipoprotein export system ATPase subunit